MNEAQAALSAFHINGLRLFNIQPLTHTSRHDIIKQIVIALEHFKNSEKKCEIFRSEKA